MILWLMMEMEILFLFKKIFMRKKVIFIASTSFSGSTMLDMILGNDKLGFSCGELRGFMNPWRKNHLETDFISDESEMFWTKVKNNGVSNIYNTIFDSYPNIRYIVDSTKDLFWIKKRSKEILKEGKYDIRYVILWKSPVEFAKSLHKRDSLKIWEYSWVKYYRLAFSLLDKFVTVKYSRLVQDDYYLQALCNELEIPYHTNKREFWNKRQFTLSGNRNAKIHLSPSSDSRYSKIKETLIKENIDKIENIDSNYRKIYYEDIEDFDREFGISQIAENNKYIKHILNVFSNYDVYSSSNNENFNYSKITYSRYRIILFKLIAAKRISYLRLLLKLSQNF